MGASTTQAHHHNHPKFPHSHYIANVYYCLCPFQIAKDATFTQHLKDTLTLKLLTLNQVEFEGINDQDCDIAMVMDSLSDCVLTSRLVAKFLGFLHFFPYICHEKQSAVLGEQYQLLRSAMAPPLDIGHMLEQAIAAGRCLILMPWLVQYLSHVDLYTISLPYYKRILTILSAYLCRLKSNLGTSRLAESTVLQYACLTWLFSLPQLEEFVVEPDLKLQYPEATSIDSSLIVNIKLVYDCSDILRSVKGILVEYIMGMKSKVNVSRKITPLTADLNHNQEPANNTTKNKIANIQQVLEDNFFQNQPASLKKSVGFISERVSSSYIKEFRSTVLTNGLLAHRLWLYNQAKAVDNLTEVKCSLAPVVADRSQQLYGHLHEQALTGVNLYFEKRVKAILEMLLPSDTECHITQICSAVIFRQGLERIKKWLKTNLTLAYISAELNQELVKYQRTSGNSAAPDCKLTDVFAKLGFRHNTTAPSPTDTLMELQLFTGHVLANPNEDISTITLVDIISQNVSCIIGREDIVLIALKSMCQLLVTLLVLVASYHPEKITPSVLECINRLWGIKGLDSYWPSLVTLVPKVEGLSSGSDTLPERFYEFIVSQQGLCSVKMSVSSL